MSHLALDETVGQVARLLLEKVDPLAQEAVLGSKPLQAKRNMFRLGGHRSSLRNRRPGF
jgi:hypothetical protein